MVESVELKNFGPLGDLTWKPSSGLNLVLGSNGAGKTFLLKAIYSALRTLEDFKRGDDQRSLSDILADKLYWTFQADKIGDLVSHGATSPLSCSLSLKERTFHYSFGKDTTRQISQLTSDVSPLQVNSIFLPAKEVLSLHQIILKSRDIDKLFGFDDTYVDLARALQIPTSKGNNYREFAQSRKTLEDLLGGSVEFDESTLRWRFAEGKNRFAIGTTAEGVKKIAILDKLLGNGYLKPSSVVFIDEPESALHPVAISTLLEILATLSSRGMQFFLASHSYFVVKKLALIAMDKGISIPVISSVSDSWRQSDLRDGIPDNPIINESIRLYEQEVELALK